MRTNIATRFKNMISAMFPAASAQPAKEPSYNRRKETALSPVQIWALAKLNSGQKWPRGISGSSAPTIIDSGITLQNVRRTFHESVELRALITRRRDIAIDRGLKVEPMPAWDILGIKDEGFKDAWITEREERFDIYMQSKQCHRAGLMTGYQMQRLWGMFDGRDNDQFARFFYNRDASLMNPVQLEFIDPTQILGNSYTDTIGMQDLQYPSTNVISSNFGGMIWRDGIKRNERGEEIAYNVRVKIRENGQWRWKNVEIPAKGARSGRIFMIHGFEPEYAGQGRGYSRFHFAIQDLQQITDYKAAHLAKAIKQSDMIGFIEPGDNPSSNPFEDLMDSGPQVSKDFAIVDNEEDGEFQLLRPEYATRVPGSDFIANLREKEKIKFLEDTAPVAQFDMYLTSMFTYLSAASGDPIETVLMKFNANYSASRAALLQAQRNGIIMQDDVKADLMDAWYLMHLSEDIASGRVKAAGWQDPVLRMAWSRYRLQGPALPSISPRDDLASIGDKLKYSLTTQDREARQLNGSSAKANATQNAKMFKLTPTVPWEDEPEAAEIPKTGQGSSNNDRTDGD